MLSFTFKKAYIRLLRALQRPKDQWISEWNSPPPLTQQEEENSQKILERIKAKIRSNSL